MGPENKQTTQLLLNRLKSLNNYSISYSQYSALPPKMDSFLQSFKRYQLVSLLLKIQQNHLCKTKWGGGGPGELDIYLHFPQTFFSLFLSFLFQKSDFLMLQPILSTCTSRFLTESSPPHTVLQSRTHLTPNFLSKYAIIRSIDSRAN